MKNTSKLLTSAEMYPLIRQWQSSGLSKSEYCSVHNIKLHTFYYWEQKYRKETADSINKVGQFVELQINTTEEQGSEKLIICCPNGVYLKFVELPSPSYLCALLKAM
jgi:hypothetical protein